MGIGQLFFFLKLLPTFSLLTVGRGTLIPIPHNKIIQQSNNNKFNGIWRIYKLEAEGLSCIIREEFVSNVLQLETNIDNTNTQSRL